MSYFFMIFPIQDTDSTKMPDFAMRDKDGSEEAAAAAPAEESDLAVLRRESNSALSILIFPVDRASCNWLFQNASAQHNTSTDSVNTCPTHACLCACWLT